MQFTTFFSDETTSPLIFDTAEQEWTALGNLLLIAVIVGLFALTMFILKRKSKKISEQQLVFSAMAIALGSVLSNLKLYDPPTGGSITLFSMLIICLPGYWYGTGVGLMCGLTYGVLQLLMGPYVIHPMQLILDYILSFAALGLSGIFSEKKNGLTLGYICAVIGRFIFSVLSGWIFFGEYAWEGYTGLTYSLVYNAIYLFGEMILTLIVIQIPAVKGALKRIKTLATDTSVSSGK